VPHWLLRISRTQISLAVARLTKGFTSQVDSLARPRRGGEQRVVVEHVHVHSGAQAIVGAVTHTGGPRALIENQGQAHATNNAGPIVASDGEEMRCQNPDRETVGVRGLLVCCADYRCSHSVAVMADQWADDVQPMTPRHWWRAAAT
jgi:hypothetical protein